MSEDKICGRSFIVQKPGPKGKLTRFLVEGINHPKGSPIRFKSRKRDENHIRNMRLELAE